MPASCDRPPRFARPGFCKLLFLFFMADQGALGKKPRVEAFRSVALGIVVAVSSATVVWMSIGTPPAPIDTTGFPSNPIARHEPRDSAVRAAAAARGAG